VARAAAPRAREPVHRKLRLFAQRRANVFGDGPGYGFVLQEGAREPAPDSIGIPGPQLALTRGEPVEITVVNRARMPLSVHWHGIELESYYDGVAGWSGDARRIAPPIAANDSFVVRFTPPRAGTFIYHVHDEGGTELASGLYGPLIVREPGDDTSRDRVFVVSDAGPGRAVGTFVNGTATPDTLELVAGRTYRFRIVSITANGPRFVSLADTTGPHVWRTVARDGWEHERKAPPSTQRVRLGPGMTVDYEVTPAAAGGLTLTAVTPLGPNRSGTPTVVPIRVREARSVQR
jgi:FtsP/CotA-like multicopper oxidase with cupredoxin domain